MLKFALSALAVAALCAAPASAQDCTTWYETTKHGPGFRNVKDYGAKGDGVTDDSAAILAALTQNRSPKFETADPTIVYLPPGNYLVSKTLPLYFYTHLVGNFRCVPTITLAPGAFGGGRAYLIDADPNDPNSGHTDEFYRAILNVNLVIGANNKAAIGVHWAVSQATMIRNVVIDMTACTPGGGSMGMFMENGSGGFMSDMVILGGDTGLEVGNQQWTFRNITIVGSSLAVNLIWDWSFVFQALNITNSPLGIQFNGGADGQVLLLDSTMTNVATAIVTAYPNRLPGIYLERFTATNVPTITPGLPGNANGQTYIPAWRQGPAFTNYQLATGNQSTLPLTRPDTPLPQRPRPNFGGAIGTDNFTNVYDYGAKGDGVNDDTAAIQAAVNAAANGQVFLPQGVYLVSAPINLKTNTVLVGEALSNIQAKTGSAAWSDATNPKPLLALPAGAASAPLLADLIFTSSGDVPGCIFLDWQSGPGTGAWDVHWRAMHTGWGLLRVSGAGSGGVLENSWAWVADHDIDSGATITVVNPRGVTIDGSTGGFTCVGCAAEHSANWQYSITDSSSITFLFAQTETAYWQNPPTGWAMTTSNTAGLRVYGTGFYNWFNGQQAAVFNVTSCPDAQLYGINTYGTVGTVQVGDAVLSNATTPALNQWFTEGYTAAIHQ